MKKLLFLFIATAGVFAACKKNERLEMPRLFRPPIAEVLSADSNTIVASWLSITEAKNYTVQVSRDTFETVDLSITIDTNIAVIKKLLFNQLYQVQVKANAPDSTKNSKWSYLGAIKTLGSILKVPGPDDITMNSVRVRWTTKGSPVTSIKIVKASDNTTVSTTSLTPADITGEFKIIDGLAPETKYIIYLYSGTDERGYVSFTSKAPFSGTVIDLTGITGRPSVLLDTLPVVPAGSTILLKKGLTYNINAGYGFNKSLIIMSAPDLTIPTQAKIYMTTNFSFAAGSSIDSIEFNDVFMYSDNYGSRYIFNNTNSANVGKLKFLNSRMEIFRGMVRLQSGTVSMGNFIIDNCIVDSVGNFSMLNISASSKIDNISLTKSTFYKIEGIIASAQNSTSVVIDNFTFNETPLGNNRNYYFDYNALNITNGISITNSLFGIGKNSAGAFTIKGLRVGATTLINVSNNYRTSDQASGGNDIPSISTYTRPTGQLWLDPYNGNFKIIDNGFPGRSNSGDPRWRL
jgi:hypothetical protein